MEFKPSDLIALAAILSSLIIAIFTLFINRNSVLKVSHQQTMGPMRLKRIEDIRNALSEFIALVYSNSMGRKLGLKYNDDEKKEMLLKITETNIKVKLLLTKGKDSHQKLADKLDEWIDVVGIKDDEKYSKEINLFVEEIMSLSKIIFEDQWEKIKKSK